MVRNLATLVINRVWIATIFGSIIFIYFFSLWNGRKHSHCWNLTINKEITAKYKISQSTLSTIIRNKTIPSKAILSIYFTWISFVVELKNQRWKCDDFQKPVSEEDSSFFLWHPQIFGWRNLKLATKNEGEVKHK